MLSVTVTYQNGKVPYNAAEVNAPTQDVNEALNYAFRWTQNIDGSWSNKIGGDANDNVTPLHYYASGTGLRSSMVGDEFTVWFEDKTFKKFRCMPIGFKDITFEKFEEVV